MFTRYAKEHGIRVTVFDIKGKIRGIPSVIINDSFLPDFLHYDVMTTGTRVCSGPDYFLLPQAYRKITKPVINPDVKNILITMGGSDPAGLTVKILQVLENLPSNMHYHFILGPTFKNIETVSMMSNHFLNAVVYIYPSNFMEILTNADIVITAAGRTLMECSYLGIPTIIVPSIDHEELIALQYSRLTGATNIGIWNDISSQSKLIDALIQYIETYLQRKQISDSAKKIIDGNGLFRILMSSDHYKW